MTKILHFKKQHQMSDPRGGLRGGLTFSLPLGGGPDFFSVFCSTLEGVLLFEIIDTGIDGPASGSFGFWTTFLLLFMILITIL